MAAAVKVAVATCVVTNLSVIRHLTLLGGVGVVVVVVPPVPLGVTLDDGADAVDVPPSLVAVAVKV